MTKSKDTCPSCNEGFAGRQQFLRCCGPCGSRFHCKCINVVGQDYEFYMVTGESTYKCHSCTRRNDEEGLRPAGKQASLAAASGAAVGDDVGLRELVVALFEKIDALSLDVRRLKSDNESLRLHLANNTDLLRKHIGSSCASNAPSADVSVLQKEASCKGGGAVHVPPNSMENARFSVGVCPPENGGSHAFHSRPSYLDALQKFGDMNGLAPKRRYIKASVGKAGKSKLVSVPRVVTERALFVSRLDPATTAADIRDDLAATLPEIEVTCTKLPSRYDTYASFHVSVKAEMFDVINEASVWPVGCIFRPFWGKLRAKESAEDE